MTEDDVERVARAMFAHEWRNCSCVPWEEFETSRDYWTESAQVAITALQVTEGDKR